MRTICIRVTVVTLLACLCTRPSEAATLDFTARPVPQCPGYAPVSGSEQGVTLSGVGLAYDLMCLVQGYGCTYTNLCSSKATALAGINCDGLGILDFPMQASFDPSLSVLTVGVDGWMTDGNNLELQLYDSNSVRVGSASFYAPADQNGWTPFTLSATASAPVAHATLTDTFSAWACPLVLAPCGSCSPFILFHLSFESSAPTPAHTRSWGELKLLYR